MADIDLSLFPVETCSESETRSLGAAFASGLVPGSVVALFGEIGSGKTQFVKGVCRALGIAEERVSSPTFTIVHEYAAQIPIYHLDLYRIRSEEEAARLGLDEYLESDGICLIEWPEILVPRLPSDTVRLSFRHMDGDVRKIEISD